MDSESAASVTGNHGNRHGSEMYMPMSNKSMDEAADDSSNSNDFYEVAKGEDSGDSTDKCKSLLDSNEKLKADELSDEYAERSPEDMSQHSSKTHLDSD